MEDVEAIRRALARLAESGRFLVGARPPHFVALIQSANSRPPRPTLHFADVAREDRAEL